MSFNFGFENDDIDDTVEEAEIAPPARSVQERSVAKIPLPALHKLEDMVRNLRLSSLCSVLSVSMNLTS